MTPIERATYISRLRDTFSCLEALAYRLKKGSKGSRDAVRQLLGVPKGKTGQCVIEGRKYDYDVLLAAGLIRNKLYHGARLNFSKPARKEKDTIALLANHPETIASSMKSHVELEIARWSNGASNGQVDQVQSSSSENILSRLKTLWATIKEYIKKLLEYFRPT